MSTLSVKSHKRNEIHPIMDFTTLEDGKCWNVVYKLLRKNMYIHTPPHHFIYNTCFETLFCFYVVDIFGNI